MRGKSNPPGPSRRNANSLGAAFVLTLVWTLMRASAADVSDALPLKYETPVSLTGNIYDATGTNVLFKFKRTATRAGTNLSVLREFTDLDGKVAARESLIYQGDKLVSYALDELQIGANGNAKILRDPKNQASGKIEFSYLQPGGKFAKATESLRADTLTSDMLGSFLADHWADLSQGRDIKCRYLVVPRKETVGFTFSRHAETTWQGTSVVVIRMEPSSRIIALIVDPLYFMVEKDGLHRVLQYTGRTTPKIKSKAAWKDLDAITVFDWK